DGGASEGALYRLQRAFAEGRARILGAGNSRPGRPYDYVPNLDGPSIRPLSIQDGTATELPAIYPIVYAPKMLPPNFELPLPSSRPPCLASLHRELQLHIRGRVVPAIHRRGSCQAVKRSFSLMA